VRRLGTAFLETLATEQDRWFVWVPVMFGAGIALYFSLPTEPAHLAAVAALLLAVVLRVIWRAGAAAMLIGGALAATATGFAAAKLRTDWIAAPVLKRQSGPVDVRGWIELVEPRPSGGQRVTLLVSAITGLALEDRPQRVRLRLQGTNPALKAGDAVAVRAMLSPPAGPALPGGYDFARAAWFQGLGAVGFALAPVTIDANAERAPASMQARAAIERVRQAIGARVTAALPGERGEMANALITGQRGGISDATNDAFRDSGLLHILSISGLHMVVMAGAVFMVVRFALALMPAVALRFPIKKWAAAAAMLAALGYLLISGASFPTVRSWIMISIMFVAVMLDRPAVALRNVAVTALVILIVFPESLMDVSFQMSFAAVVALVSAYELLRNRERDDASGSRSPVYVLLLFFGGIVLSTLVASAAVAPFAAYHFHKSQQYAVLANLVAIPICNIVVMPAALLTLVAMPLGLEWGPLQVMGWGIDAMTWCAYRVAALPGAVGHIPAIPAAAFALMLTGGLWLTLWRTRWRLLGLVPVALGLAVAPLRQAPDILVGRDGTLVAVREGKAGLSALAGRGGMFELGRWLEHDGDARTPEIVAEAKAFRCDAAGCVAEVAGRVVAVARHAAALRDDCAAASVRVVVMAEARACTEGGITLSQERLRALGAHAIFFNGATVSVQTVADTRGKRPWTATSVDADALAE
jgi:competence protein ComEC